MATACVGLMLTACVTGQEKLSNEDIFADVVPESIAPAAPLGAQLPKSVAKALEYAPSVDDQAIGSPKEPRYDVMVESLSPQAFFMGVVEGTGYNVVVHPRVRGAVTLRLSRVTVPEIIETACRVYNFDCQHSGVGYIVSPAILQTRQYHVDYLRIQRRGMTRTKISSGQTATASSSAEDQQGNTTDSNVETISGSEVVTDQQSDFWNEFSFNLCGILGLIGHGSEGENAAGQNQSTATSGWNTLPVDTTLLGCNQAASQSNSRMSRWVVISPQTGNIVVRAYPDELRQIETFIDNQKGVLERQVILEAKILEVELTDGFQSGVNWTAFFDSRHGQSSVGMTGGGSSLGDNAVSSLFSDNTSQQFSASGLADVTANSAFGGTFSMALALDDFTTFIELLETQGDVKVLSSPRVSTLNNQKAVIRVGQDELFVTDLNFSTESDEVNLTTTYTVTPEFTTFFSGIALDVTPQISEQGQVILHIHPSVSEVTIDEKQLTVGSNLQTYPLALNRVRESDTIVRAASGEVVVIGGLMKNATVDRDAGVPVLSDIPLLGKLFTHEQQSIKKTELVILVRPVVVKNATDWKQEVDQSINRMRRMQIPPTSSWNQIRPVSDHSGAVESPLPADSAIGKSTPGNRFKGRAVEEGGKPIFHMAPVESSTISGNGRTPRDDPLTAYPADDDSELAAAMDEVMAGASLAVVEQKVPGMAEKR
ncbi:MAG: pilus (MSHA type) biogenesis protein MshL [Magnetococcales bacterium]|nr:pilus (MSHA type) biogenesis protein MshL [Magnetococcales bacterium]